MLGQCRRPLGGRGGPDLEVRPLTATTRALRWAGAAVVVVVVACTAPGGPQPPAGAFEVRVVRVVDGDTFIARVTGGERRVRLIGVDAPESVAPGAPVECYGRRAGRVLAGLLPEGSTVRAAYQEGGNRDRFGRDLWDVWLPGGRFVQARLVRVGAAQARAYPPHTDHADLLDRVEARARAAGVGLWGAC